MQVEPNKWGIVYNPRSGLQRFARKRWKAIREYIVSRHIPFEYNIPQDYMTAEEIARGYANRGFKTIVAVGGDGIVSDVVNGIMKSDLEDKSSVAIGIIPNGIGNDFAGFWGLTSDYKDAIEAIISRRTRRIALFVILFLKKTYRTHLVINDEHLRGRVMTVCIGNAHGYGQTPSAVPYNGWLDVTVIYRPEKKLQILKGLWMSINGRLFNHKNVRIYRTKAVKVLRVKNAMTDVDGRIYKHGFPLEIGILNEHLTIIIPNR